MTWVTRPSCHCAALLEKISTASPMGTPYSYTTSGFGPREYQKMDGVYNFLVCMQTAQRPKFPTVRIYTTMGALRSCGGIEILLYIYGVCTYTKKWYTPAIFLFFLGPSSVGVYIYGVPNQWQQVKTRQQVVEEVPPGEYHCKAAEAQHHPRCGHRCLG